MFRYFVIFFAAFLIEKCHASIQEPQGNDICKSLVNNVPQGKCLHHPDCPNNQKGHRCQRIHPNCTNAIFCCNISSVEMLRESLRNDDVKITKLEILHIKNANFDSLNVSDTIWKNLEHMSIVDGQIKQVSGQFKTLTRITCLNLSSNGIMQFSKRSLVPLHKLRILDLSKNNLSDIPSMKEKDNVSLDISDNDPLLCSNVYNAINKTTFINKNNTMCLSAKNFSWFNSTERVPLLLLEQLYELAEEHSGECPANCTCEANRIDFLPGQVPILSLRVNCSGLGLKTLPKLPPNTRFLNVSNNNITSLEPLITDTSYKSLRELYADNNAIKSIKSLEGSKLLDNLIALSLRNNSFNELPTYVLSNIFDRNMNAKVFLGHNKLKCDCNNAVLKSWLNSKKSEIRDFDEIYCEDSNTQKNKMNPSPDQDCVVTDKWMI